MYLTKEYKIAELIDESPRSYIYNAKRIRDNVSVCVKVFKEDYRNKNYDSIKENYDIISDLDSINGIIKYYEFNNNGEFTFIVMENINGKSLRKIFGSKKMEYSEFLYVAIKIVEILIQIHEKKLVHKDLNLDNIIYNEDSKEIRISGLSKNIQTLMESNKVLSANYKIYEFECVSPEKVGITNRSITYKSDFYSLGMILYELLYGVYPLKYNDLNELVYNITNLNIFIPKNVNKSIPKSIFNIIKKLIEKYPEDRYKSGKGILNDLKFYKNFLNSTEMQEINLSESICYDNNFLVSEKLYGRKKEYENLIEQFNRSCKSKKEIVFINGEDGIGKSTLVKELMFHVKKNRGIFIQGNFEKFQRNNPYYAVYEVLNKLIDYILLESNDKKENWKEKIQSIFKDNIQILIKFIPKIKEVIGISSELPSYSHSTEYEVNYFLLKFLNIFCSRGNPLVIFFDDIQWADYASLKFLNLLLKDEDFKYLYLIFAYNDEFFNDNYSINETKENLKKNNIEYNKIRIDNLRLNDITNLVIDTLDNEIISKLNKLVFDFSKGNPLYAKQLLSFMYSNRYIFYNEKWAYDNNIVAEINEYTLEDVVRLTVDKLDYEAQSLIKLLSCFASKVNKTVLYEIFREPLTDLIKILNLLKKKNFINEYNHEEEKIVHFVHHNIKQMIYYSIKEDERQLLHKKIGKYYLKKTGEKHNTFIAVDQFNRAINILNDEEKITLSELNYLAGLKSKESNAFDLSYDYLNYGIGLLPKNSWKNDYKLSFNFHLNLIECAKKTCRYDVMWEKADVVLKNSKNLLDKIKIYLIIIQGATIENKPYKSVELCREILKELKFNLPKSVSSTRINVEYKKTKNLINRISKYNDFSKLIDNKEHTDLYKERTIKLLDAVGSALFVTNFKLYMYSTLKRLQFVIIYSNSADDKNVYYSYASILCSTLNDIGNGYQLCKDVNKHYIEYEKINYDVKSNFVYNVFIRHWRESVTNTISPLKEIYSKSLEYSNIEYSVYSAFMYSLIAPFSGENIVECLNVIEYNLSIYKKVNQKHGIITNRLFKQVFTNFVKENSKPWIINGEYAQESETLNILQENNNKSSVAGFYIVKLILAYLFDEYKDVNFYINKIKEFEDSIRGMYLEPLFLFFETLVLLNIIKNNKTDYKYFIKEIQKNIKKFKKWSFYSPKNYLHKFYLLEAKYSYISGNKYKTEVLLKKAVDSVARSKIINEEAIINEVLGVFNIKEGFFDIGKMFIRTALNLYEKWGAYSKVKFLIIKYSNLFNLSDKNFEKNIYSRLQSNAEENYRNSLIKMSQMISNEIILENFISKLLKVTASSINALYGVLIMLDNEVFKIKATFSSEKNGVVIYENSKNCTEKYLPIKVLNFCIDLKKLVTLHNAFEDSDFADDEYIYINKVKSVLCIPIIDKKNIIGVLYYENKIVEGFFRLDKLEIINMLLSQISVSIINALRYRKLTEINEELENILIGKTKNTTVIYNKLQTIYHKSKKLNNIDMLTGLLNKKVFLNRLKGEVLGNKILNKKFCLIICEVVNFKDYNNKYGFKCGDYILLEISKILSNNIRVTDNIGKWKGRSFIIKMADTSISNSKAMTERIRDKIVENNFVFENIKLDIEVKFGISEFDDGKSIDECIINIYDVLENSEKTSKNKVYTVK